MTLSVWAYRRTPEGAIQWINAVDPYNDLAGLENWRTTVWGSAEFRELGLMLLPSLSQTNLFVEGLELDELDAEIATILASTADEGIRFRAMNIREAIRIARCEPDGGVHIG